MFDGTLPDGPLSSRPNLGPTERRAVRRSLAIAASALLAGIAATAPPVVSSGEVPRHLAFIGP